MIDTRQRRHHHHHHDLTDNAEAVRDMSHWQEANPDFGALRAAGIMGVILKASQGVDFRDPTFHPRAAAAARAGLLVGAYHFMDASDPILQMQNFAQYVEAQALLFALDFEPNPDSQAAVEQVSSSAQWLLEQVGRRPVIYTIRSMFTAPDPFLSTCGLWIADWSPEAEAPITDPGWPSWRLWQYATDNETGGHSRWSGRAKDFAEWWSEPTA